MCLSNQPLPFAPTSCTGSLNSCAGSGDGSLGSWTSQEGFSPMFEPVGGFSKWTPVWLCANLGQGSSSGISLGSAGTSRGPEANRKSLQGLNTYLCFLTICSNTQLVLDLIVETQFGVRSFSGCSILTFSSPQRFETCLLDQP